MDRARKIVNRIRVEEELRVKRQELVNLWTEWMVEHRDMAGLNADPEAISLMDRIDELEAWLGRDGRTNESHPPPPPAGWQKVVADGEARRKAEREAEAYRDRKEHEAHVGRNYMSCQHDEGV